MIEINRKPAYTVTELASVRQHQKTGRPSWSARERVGFDIFAAREKKKYKKGVARDRLKVVG